MRLCIYHLNNFLVFWLCDLWWKMIIWKLLLFLLFSLTSLRLSSLNNHIVILTEFENESENNRISSQFHQTYWLYSSKAEKNILSEKWYSCQDLFRYNCSHLHAVLPLNADTKNTHITHRHITIKKNIEINLIPELLELFHHFPTPSAATNRINKSQSPLGDSSSSTSYPKLPQYIFLFDTDCNIPTKNWTAASSSKFLYRKMSSRSNFQTKTIDFYWIHAILPDACVLVGLQLWTVNEEKTDTPI